MTRRGASEDPKVAALREARCLNPHPEQVTDEAFRSQEFFDARDAVQVKYEMVRRVRVDGDAVTAAAAAFGYSRPSYYEAAAALDEAGLDGLVPGKPGPRRGHKLTDEVCAFADHQLSTDPSLRPADLVEPIEARFGVHVHPRSIERALARYREQQSKSR
jgi:transposase